MFLLGAICLQDFRERKVYWFLFPFLGMVLCTIYYGVAVDSIVFLLNIALNMIFMVVVVLLIFLYAKIIAKQKFVNHSLGLGDMLFFVAIALGFPTVTFLILFVNALLFSLLGFLVLKGRLHQPTVPLAGFMSVFFIVLLGYSLFFKTPSLYVY